jgi:hypothetical protein
MMGCSVHASIRWKLLSEVNGFGSGSSDNRYPVSAVAGIMFEEDAVLGKRVAKESRLEGENAERHGETLIRFENRPIVLGGS